MTVPRPFPQPPFDAFTPILTNEQAAELRDELKAAVSVVASDIDGLWQQGYLRGIHLDFRSYELAEARGQRDAALAQYADHMASVHPSTPPPTTPPPTTVTFPVAGDLISFTGSTVTRALSGVNISRGTDMLVCYKDPTTTTTTSQWGVEVAVGSDGRVVAVNNRQASGSTAGTAVPTGGYVLSGHNVSADFLLAQAQVGDLVTVGTPSSGGGTTTPPSTGGTTNPTSPAPSTLLELMWCNRWHERDSTQRIITQAPRLRDYPTDQKAEYDIYVLAMMQSAQSGTGRLTPIPLDSYANAAELKADVDVITGAGGVVAVGLGGSNDGGITIDSDATALQAADGVTAEIIRLGANGVNLDLEPSGSRWNQAGVVKFIGILKQRYPNLYVDVCVGLYSPHTSGWIALGKALGANMNSMSVMLYDFIEASDSRLSSVSVDKVNTLVNGGIPASKVILLYMMRPTSTYTNATPTPSLVVNAVAAAKQAHPTLKGFGWWEDRISRARSWDGPRAVQAAN